MTQNSEFKKEQRIQLRRRPEIQRDTYNEIVRLLKLAETNIKASLASAPTDWELFYLPQLQQSVKQSMTEFGQLASAEAGTGSTLSWQAGVDLVDQPILAANVAIKGMIPQIDNRQLLAMRSFLTNKIQGLSVGLINKINTDLGLVAIGAQSTGQAISSIERTLDSGGRQRALTILRTELGRAYSVAAQQRMTQAVEVLPGMKKQWRRSGKLHSRTFHDYIDGQIQPVDKPFQLSGTTLMHPRDPRGLAKETINCGCESLPWMEHWEVKNPDRKAFTTEEIAANPQKADLAELFSDVQN